MPQGERNDFDTTHEIPQTRPDEDRGEKEFKGQNLLELDEKKAARRMLRDWNRSHNRVKRFLEEWKVNQARSQGFTGVKLVKIQDESRFHVPLGAVPSVTSMNKAIRLKRRLRATLFADPPAPEVEPSSDSDEDRDSAEFSKRALHVLSGPSRTRYYTRSAQAWELGSDYGSGFIHFWVDEHLGGRVRSKVMVRGPIPATETTEEVPAPKTVKDGLLDPRTNLPWQGETVERLVAEDGQTLVDEPSEAGTKWLPGLDLELLTGKNVRFHPYTAMDIWDADGVSIGMMIPLGELRRMFPEKINALSDEQLGKLVRARPDKWKELKRVGDEAPGEGQIKDDTLVFRLIRYQRQSAQYPEGAVLVMAGDDLMLNRETWYDEFNDSPLWIPLTQMKQYDDEVSEGNPYGKGVMFYMGPGNEIRASILGTMLEWLDKFRTRKTFVPITSTLQAKQLQSPTKTVLPMSPGGQPHFEQVPELPNIVKEMMAFVTADLDDESGLQETGQALSPTSVTSGRQLQTLLDQVRVGLSQLQHNAEQGILRGWGIMLQLARAFFEEQQQIGWMGEDGEYKRKKWNGSDLSDNTDVTMAKGSFTLMGPELKAEVAASYQAGGFISLQAATRAIQQNVAPLLALGEDRHRQRVRRQISSWEQGEPEGWIDQRTEVLVAHSQQLEQQMQALAQQIGPGAAPEQVQQVQAQMEQIAATPPPPDPVLAQIFRPLPVDEEPEVAMVRAYELGLSISSSVFSRWSDAWQQGIVTEYLRMRQAAGIVTIAEQAEAQQQAVSDQATLEAQQQQADLQEAQIKAGAEVEKVQITQQGSLQKELVKAGAQPGSVFPETIAPPTLQGSEQTVPGVTGERSLPGLPN